MEQQNRIPKKVNESKAVMTEIVMPNDTNPMDNLMGGNLLRWMDIASSICAGRHCEAHVVTASVDHVSFTKPIKMVEVSAADIRGHNSRRSNHAYYTFVALDGENGKPIAAPEVLPLTEIEQQRYDSAIRRRELRLILSGRMKVEQAKELKMLFSSLPNEG